jgi:exonuclease V gamma subunit
MTDCYFICAISKLKEVAAPILKRIDHTSDVYGFDVNECTDNFVKILHNYIKKSTHVKSFSAKNNKIKP